MTSGALSSVLPRLRGLSVPLMVLGVLGSGLAIPAGAQEEELTLPELEGLYRGAVAGYEEAFEVLEVLESQFDRASRDLVEAIETGDEEATNRLYAETQRLGSRRRLAQRRVNEKAAELREARGRLLDAHAEFLGELLVQAEAAADTAAERELAVFIADTRNRIFELRSLEDPQVELEPEDDISAEPRDTPEALRNKARILDIRANQYEDQYAYNEEQLDGLRRDQNLLRRTDDFLADYTRFDDPTTLVGPPGSRTVPPTEQAPPVTGADSTMAQGQVPTLEQRIQDLELLQEEITERIETIRLKAATLRRLAGGEWA